MPGRAPYRPPSPYPIGAALLAITVLVVGIVVTTEIAGWTFARQLGPLGSSVLGPTSRSAFVDPRRAVPAILQYDWSCYGFDLHPANVAVSLLPHPAKTTTPTKSTPRCSTVETKALSLLNTIFAVGYGASFVLMYVAFIAGGISRGARDRRAFERIPKPPPKFDPATPLEKRPFMLHVGKSTGTLIDLGHGAGISPGHDVVLVGDDACQNIVLYGGISSGKTNEINRLVLQALKQSCGMLAFDVKGDWGRTLRALAAMAGRPVVTIGVGGRPFNLLAGLTPEVAAGFLKSVFILAGSAPGGVVYVDTATNYAKNLLGMLSFVPERYSLRGLYDAVFDPAARKSLAIATKAKLTELQDSDRLAFNRLTGYFRYVSQTFPSFDPRIKKGAETSLSQILDAFQLEEIDRAFCRGGEGAISMEEVMNGTIFLLDLPISIYGLSAKTVYTLVKLRFMNVVKRRRVEPTWNQSCQLVFVADEYQQIVSVAGEGESDLSFWDTSRSAGCVGLISAQGYESFRAVIRDASLTASMLQNFRQQICFQTSDFETIRRMIYLLGKVPIQHEHSSMSRSQSTRDASHGESQQYSVRDEDVINPQFFRKDLERGRALALLSINGKSYDDMLIIPKLEIDDKAYADVLAKGTVMSPSPDAAAAARA